MTMHVESWLYPTPEGLYCEPGAFWIDPIVPVERAVLTHGHADHARPGHHAVLATYETLAILRARYGDQAGRMRQAVALGRALTVGGVQVSLLPAGHVLGSAQVLLEHGGARVLVTGDFKRREDPTCLPCESVRCDLLVTESTFGLPVFRHPPLSSELERLLAALSAPGAPCHLIGVYALGKCQRLIAELRGRGYERPIYLHGALSKLTALYAELGVALGPVAGATEAPRGELEGQLVLAPPSAISDRWTRRLPEHVVGLASGFMAIRARARQRGVELPLVISDHADWDELTAHLEDSGAGEVWVSHGLTEGLVHFARESGRSAHALELGGYEAEEEG